MNPFIGQIKLFAGSFAPVGWALCDGQLLNIAENDTLFNLIGTTYGGDGTTTFAVPDLRSRVPVGIGSDGVNSYAIGNAGGLENVQLDGTHMIAHSHDFKASFAVDDKVKVASPKGNVLGTTPGKLFRPANPTGHLGASIDASTGTPHNNMQPYMAINYIIATAGIYPSQG